MTTEQQLREVLGAHADVTPAADDRVGQVRGRIRARRQRRAAGASLALAVVVAAVVVPLTAAGHRSAATITPIAARPSFSAVDPLLTPALPLSPSEPQAVTNPEYVSGGRKLAGAIAVSPAAGSLTYTFTPTSYRLLLTEACTTSGNLSVTVNGHALTAATCSSGGFGATGNVADAAGSSAEWSPYVHLGRPNTVVVTLVAGITSMLSATPLPRVERPAVTFASAIYQAVPIADYPFPSAPAAIQPLQAEGLRPIVLDSRRVGAQGNFVLPVTVGAGRELDVVGVAPGQATLSISGHELSVDAFWTYLPDSYGDIGLDVASLRSAGISAHDGEHLTVTVTATRFTGPYWLIDEGTHG